MAVSGQQGARGHGRNGWIVAVCLAAVFGMLGASYAAVPLYRLFCQVTGYGGTARTATNVEGIPIIDRDITVRFDANVAPSLAWNFAPARRSITVRLGEVATITYVAENTSSRPLSGTAVFNVTPQHAGAYFNKLDCFCFTETTIAPGEKLEMPVVFFVDPELADEEMTRDLATITLSYTFYPAGQDGAPLETSRTAADAGRDGS